MIILNVIGGLVEKNVTFEGEKEKELGNYFIRFQFSSV